MKRNTTHTKGQVIVITAVIVALTFLLLTTLLNTAIFAENEAARANPSGEQTGNDIFIQVNSSVTQLITQTNTQNFSTVQSVEQSTQNGLDEIQQSFEQIQETQKHLLQISETQTDIGAKITQHQNQNFSSPTNQSNWTLATNSSLRNFSHTINTSELYLYPTTNEPVTAEKLENSNAYAINFTNQTTTQTLYIVNQEQTGETKVYSVQNSTIQTICSQTTDVIYINYTDQEINNKSCDALNFSGINLKNTTLSYQNGHSATGTYTLITQKTPSTLQQSYETNSTEPLFVTPTIYNITYTFTITTPSETYTTTVTNTPNQL